MQYKMGMSSRLGIGNIFTQCNSLFKLELTSISPNHSSSSDALIMHLPDK